MSTTIDTRVVEMRFDNKQFEAASKQTLTTLENLNKGLKLDGATKGLHDLGTAAKNFSLSHISSTLDAINSRFRTMSVVAITALSNITNQAIYAGQNLIKSLTIAPVNAGLEEYETNLNSIQTILANTGLEGQKGLNRVNNALEILNEYSDKTIYNFSEMARNIGTFTAAGVKLDVATAAIKGIANLAAVSGSNAEQASRAMYQLSQAISAGKVSLEDWNSVVQAGLGGKVFQNALIETARVHGVAIDKMIKEEGSFRLTLQKGWLTSNILTETLSKFTGDLNEKQLKSMGYTKQQIAEILKMGKTAQEAATKVKTMSQLISTLQEAAGSGWAKTWSLIFGDFEEARTLFTKASDVIGGFINTSADARNSVLADWKKLGGRTLVIEGISEAFRVLGEVVKPISTAFREMFPAVTYRDLIHASYLFRDFFKNIKIGADTLINIRKTFAGLFAVIGIGWDIVKALTSAVFELFTKVIGGSGDFLTLTGRIGDFLVNLREAAQKGQIFTKFFDTLVDVIYEPIRLIGVLSRAIIDFFDGFDSNKVTKGFDDLGDKITPLGGVAGFVAKAWHKVLDVLEIVGKFLVDVIYNLADFFTHFGDYVKTGFENVNLSTLIGVGAAGTIGIIIAKLVEFFQGGKTLGIVQQVKDTIDSITGAFESMQNTLRATTLLQIALAVGVLTLSVVALSKVDSVGLTNALTAITVMFAQLGTALFLFEKHLKFDDIGKMYAIVGAMAALGIAIRILTSSVKELSDLSWNELAVGLTGTIGLLMGLILVVQHMPDDKKLFTTAITLNVLAAAVKILASAVVDLSGLDWDGLAKGLLGVGAVLGAMFLFTKFMEADKAGLAEGAGILLIAVAVRILADALGKFANLSWEEIGRGLAAMAGGMALIAAALYSLPQTSLISAVSILLVALTLNMVADATKELDGVGWEGIAKGLVAVAGMITILGLALSLVPPTAPLVAAGFVIMAWSLGMIGDALKSMGGMSWEQIAKGLVAMGGALGIIALSVTLMTGSLAGAAALLVVAASLAVLTPVLMAFGTMDWAEIGKAAAVLAGLFTILGLAGAILTPVVPTLIGLGAAILLLGVAMLAAGVGILAFSIGLKTLSLLGAEGADTMVMFVTKILDMIPMAMQKIAQGVIAFAGVIAEAGPAITLAITTVLLSLIQAIENLSPRIIEVLFKLLVLLLKTMEDAVPKMYRSGLKILIGILEGIRDNIQQIVTVALEIIANFIKGIARGLPSIIEAGVQLILSFIRGLTKAMNDHAQELGEAGGDLAVAIINGMIKGLGAGIGKIEDKARDVARSALNAAKHALGINSPSKEFEKQVGEESGAGIEAGLDNSIPGVEKSAKELGLSALDSLKKTLSNLSSLATADMDLNPVITPVLDLSNIRKNAATIDGIFSTTPLALNTSYSGAVAADNGFQINQDTNVDESSSNGGTTINFTQNNISPKALPETEIYRKTNSGLARVLEEVKP